MATLSPGPRGRPTPHPAPWPPTPGRDQVLLTSWHAGSGRPEEGESPAQAAWQPASAQQQIQAGLQGGERARRGPSAGRPRPLPLPRTRRRASSSIAGWTRAVRLCSSAFGRRGPCSRFPSAGLSSADPPADSSAAHSAGSRRPCSRHAGGRDRGTRARRGGGTRGGDAGALEQVARATAEAQPSVRGAVALPTAQEPGDRIRGSQRGQGPRGVAPL